MADETQTHEALEACPGCNKSQIRVIGGPGTRSGPKYWCGCDYCRWRTWGDTEAEAIAAWNTRASPAGDVKVGDLVSRFRRLPLNGDAGCDKLTDDEWRQVAVAAILTLSTQDAGTVALLREARDGLKCARQHIEHMAVWIANQNAGYSFEALGEDGWQWSALVTDRIDAHLSRQPEEGAGGGCPLGDACGMASTHTNKDGERCCDWCHEPLRPEPAADDALADEFLANELEVASDAPLNPAYLTTFDLLCRNNRNRILAALRREPKP